MARKPRIEFNGAIYHIINRGNYRRDIFEFPGASIVKFDLGMGAASAVSRNVAHMRKK